MEDYKIIKKFIKKVNIPSHLKEEDNSYTTALFQKFAIVLQFNHGFDYFISRSLNYSRVYRLCEFSTGRAVRKTFKKSQTAIDFLLKHVASFEIQIKTYIDGNNIPIINFLNEEERSE